MTIDKTILDLLSSECKANSRLRKNFDLCNSENDLSLKTLNASNFYDNSGTRTESVILDADGVTRAAQIEQGRWHNLETLQSDTIIVEAKDWYMGTI